jgi:hypothetical protein
MSIVYLDSLAGVTAADLQGFFVGWPDPPSPETHYRMLAGSQHILLARDAATGQIVGFINAVSDGVLAAYIPLLEVSARLPGAGRRRRTGQADAGSVRWVVYGGFVVR